MAKLVQGVLGGFSGKVGTVVGSMWKGIATIRAYVATISNPNTPAQLEQRAKFKLVLEFLRPLTSFLRISFKSMADKQTTFNQAMKVNLLGAIKGIFPLLEIDFTKVVLSQGNLGGALNPLAASTVAAKVDFSWDDNVGDSGAVGTDTPMLVVYNPSLKKAATFITGGTRSLGTQTVTLPDAWSGMEVECYIAFQNKEIVSDSTYISTVLVA